MKSPEEKAREFVNSEDIKQAFSPMTRMWLEQHIIALLKEVADPYPDTEADGIVFCGKCGKME